MGIQGGFFIGQTRKYHGWLICLGTGILAAVLLALLHTEMMDTVGASRVWHGEIMFFGQPPAGYFFYLLMCRGLPFYLLLMITWRTGKRTFFNLYFIYCGFVYGVQAILLTMQYQLSAVWLLMAQLMPQVLCYGAALYLGYGMNGDIDSRRTILKKTGLCALIWTAGLAAEWYLNPFVLNFCMKYLL